MIFILGLFILKISTTTAQFPKHLDLEKVQDINFKNEKYTMLRPTVHIVKDYFKDFLRTQEEKGIPSKRIFIDGNGFRHYWTGFEEHMKILRKANIVKGVKESVANAEEKKQSKEDKTVDDDDDEENNESSEATTLAKSEEATTTVEPSNLRDGGTRTVAKTTFFCPFFGLITMQSYLD